jgi:hypothetical protein
MAKFLDVTAVDPMTVVCPHCGARRGEACLEFGESWSGAVHFERLQGALQGLEQQTRNRVEAAA